MKFANGMKRFFFVGMISHVNIALLLVGHEQSECQGLPKEKQGEVQKIFHFI